MFMKKQLVLIHGFLSKSPVMAYLASYFHKLDYDIHYFNYRTVHFERQKTFDKLNTIVKDLDNVYFLAHSMGGLVVREFIQEFPSDQYKAVVTLGTPHRSSSFAKMVSKSELNNLLGMNAESGLITDLKDYTGVPPLGSLAGNQPKGLFKIYQKIMNTRIKYANDGTVLVSETQDVNFQDHITMPVSHSGMLFSRDVAEQVNYFFNNFRFNH
jgi:pimeloyl-ACP methyl ester carboxylesterase